MARPKTSVTIPRPPKITLKKKPITWRTRPRRMRTGGTGLSASASTGRNGGMALEGGPDGAAPDVLVPNLTGGSGRLGGGGAWDMDEAKTQDAGCNTAGILR